MSKTVTIFYLKNTFLLNMNSRRVCLDSIPCARSERYDTEIQRIRLNGMYRSERERAKGRPGSQLLVSHLKLRIFCMKIISSCIR